MTDRPIRVQRKRTKGWRMPPNTVSVTRPGRFGNPFDWRFFGREGAVDFYRAWLADDLTQAERASTGIDACGDWSAAQRSRVLDSIVQLRGKNLACWCPIGAPCHADILLEIANA